MSVNHQTKAHSRERLSTAEHWLMMLSGAKPVNHQADGRKRLSTTEHWLALLSGVNQNGHTGTGVKPVKDGAPAEVIANIGYSLYNQE